MSAKRRKTRLAGYQQEKDAAREAIKRYLSSIDAPPENLGRSHHQPQPDQWTISLVGSDQQVINIELLLGEYTLQLLSFFMRSPDENLADVYRHLLRRNLELSAVKFGIDEYGDIYLRADVPVAAVTEQELDRVIGICYSCADQNWPQVLRLGFGSSYGAESAHS